VSKIPSVIVDPDKPDSIVKALSEATRVVNEWIEFGNPQNPYDDQSTTLAGAGTPTTHNGEMQNIRGSWVEVEFDAANAAEAFNHNLGLDVISADEPNVRWLFTNFRHSGAGAATGCLSLEYDDALCAVSANSIDLVLRASPGGVRTIAAGANAVKCTVFFIPAVR
jgi:hypothetical protein